MERDFLGFGAAGKEQQRAAAAAAEEEDGARSRKEPAFFAGGGGAPAAMDWSFASRAGGASPPLMSFRTAAREEPRELAYPQFSAFDGAAKQQQVPRVLAPQRSFGADSRGGPQYGAVHGAHHTLAAPPQVLNGARVVLASSPFNPHNQMFRVQSSPNLPNGVVGGAFKQTPFSMINPMAGSTVGVYGTRDIPKAKASQLTIFYGGCVNVFDNISPEKAQELMFLASRGSLPSVSGTVANKPDTPTTAPVKVAVPEFLPAKQMLLQKQQHVSPPVSVITKPISIMSQTANPPRSASSCNIDSPVPKSSGPFIVPPTSQVPSTQVAMLATTTDTSIMPRAVPQARKASLARFLEKRKERVTTVSPYPSVKSPMESSDTIGSANDNSKSSCTDILSSNRDGSLCLGQPRNISFSEESPNLKLQI